MAGCNDDAKMIDVSLNFNGADVIPARAEREEIPGKDPPASGADGSKLIK